MRLRRCHCVVIQPRERFTIDLELMLSETPRLASTFEWVALAAHLDAEVRVDLDEIAVLGKVSAHAWTDRSQLEREHPTPALRSLEAKGLLVAEHAATAVADDSVRTTHWEGLSAVAHRHLRWRDVDSERERGRFQELVEGEPLAHLGPPPATSVERGPPEARIALPGTPASPLASLMARRVTCRNFDPARPLAPDDLASVLGLVFGARAEATVTGVPVLKKGSPSAGGLHPTEAYLLVRRVAGIAPGLYHYHAVAHALEPLRQLEAAEADALALRFVAVQRYFLEAPVLVIYASRFERNFWKYRQHAKAYRATILDVGHLSQTLYLAATERGLAAFFTAAVNEVDIEAAFGLDPMAQGVIGVGGFGHRADTRDEIEFDPLHAVWPA